MAHFDNLNDYIDDYINRNHEGRITGTILNEVLSQMVSELGYTCPHIVHHGAGDVTVIITPNDLHVWDNPMATLNITLAETTSVQTSEYMIRFTAPSSVSPSVNIQSVRWVEEPAWKPDCTYEISILDGLAVYAEWEGAS